MMSIWNQYNAEERRLYMRFLQVYGALSNLFRQKKGDAIPYLDSKFQETIYAKVFHCTNVDIGNTPHDVLSIINGDRYGIGLKTWMGDTPSFQKVMQLKRYQDELKKEASAEELAHKLSEIKNARMRADYQRLGLSEDKNIYHYITREEGVFFIHECAYPLIDISKIQSVTKTSTALSWNDGQKEYKYTFGDSQIWQKFDATQKDTLTLEKFPINIVEDPFSFLLQSYESLMQSPIQTSEDFVEVYLPLYSYKTKEVEEKSGLNAWNAAPKNKNSSTPRPLNEIYIPIPREFHKKYPDFFITDILNFEKKAKAYGEKKPSVRFHLQLPNGKKIPALITQDNMKGLQSGSLTERDENGKLYGQNALGQWLLIDVLGLTERKLVTRDWLQKKGTDSIRLWRKKDDTSLIYIDFAPIGSFEVFMRKDTTHLNEIEEQR